MSASEWCWCLVLACNTSSAKKAKRKLGFISRGKKALAHPSLLPLTATQHTCTHVGPACRHEGRGSPGGSLAAQRTLRAQGSTHPTDTPRPGRDTARPAETEKLLKKKKMIELPSSRFVTVVRFLKACLTCLPSIPVVCSPVERKTRGSVRTIQGVPQGCGVTAALPPGAAGRV